MPFKARCFEPVVRDAALIRTPVGKCVSDREREREREISKHSVLSQVQDNSIFIRSLLFTMLFADNKIHNKKDSMDTAEFSDLLASYALYCCFANYFP